MTLRLLAVLALAAALAAGCNFAPRIPGITPYRMEIQQGNFVSQEMVAQLKPGMTKEQVRFILGTPMVTVAQAAPPESRSPAARLETAHPAREQRKLTVLFEKGELARLDGDVVPSGGQTK